MALFSWPGLLPLFKKVNEHNTQTPRKPNDIIVDVNTNLNINIIITFYIIIDSNININKKQTPPSEVFGDYLKETHEAEQPD